MATFSFEGKNIYYEEYGEGKPLIVLNGIMMSTASWKEFIEPFSANNRLILMDFLDQGKSDRMEGDFDQAIQAEVLLGLLDHLGLDKPCIMGISYGSEVALRFAVKYPHRLERLELFNATAKTGDWLGDIGDGWNLAAHNCGESYYLTTIPVIYSPQFYMKNKEWMANRRKLLTPVFGDPKFYEAMIRLTNSSRNYDVSAELHKITCPTLVVSCEQDYLIPIHEQKFLVDHIPNCHHIIIPNSGHASMYEQPLLFAALALGFCNTSKTGFNIT